MFLFNFFLCKGFPDSSAGKESACNVGDLGSISGLGRSPGEGKGYPLQYSGLENSMDYIVYGVTKSRTQLSNFHFHFSFLHTPKISFNSPNTPSIRCYCFHFADENSEPLRN